MSAEVHPGLDTLQLGERLFAKAPRAPLSGALWTSIGLHTGLIAAALMTLGAAPPVEDSTSTEAIFVELVSSDAFSSEATATTESTASVAMLAAGTTSPEIETPPVELPEPVVEPPPPEPIPESVEEPAPEPPPEVVPEPIPPEPTPPEPTPEPVAEDPPMPTAWQATPLLAVAAVHPDPAPAAAEPPAKAPPELAPEPAKPVEKPVEAPKVSEKPKAKVAEAEPPKEKPKDKTPAAKPKAASAGKGGKNDADAAAAKASAGKSGKSGDGAAATSKYPGLVQKALRRALRFPKGAGRAGGEAQVRFTVSASGSVSGISVVRSTGNPVLDAEAVKTVQRAAPFPPIPADAGRKSWTFTMPLLFKR